jgi:signal transduction histidine kinase
MAAPAGRRYDRNMGTSPPAVSRFGPRRWLAVDVFVAAAMFALLVTSAFLKYGRHAQPERLVALCLLAALATLPVAVRRRWPLQVFAVVLVAGKAFSTLGSFSAIVMPATYVLYTVAAQESRRRSLLALAALEVAVVVNFVPHGASHATSGAFFAVVNKSRIVLASGSVFALALQFVVWLIGDAVRRHRAQIALQQRQALAEQRLEIARELHDIVAHALSVVAVQAGVGSHLIATRPDEAARSLSAIEETARAALSETRYLLGAMRGDGHDPAGLTPVPGISSVASLVRQISDTGLPVSLRVEGEPRALSPSLELSVYRVIQEALTNMVRHAGQPASTEVVISYADDGVLVTVTDNGRGQRMSQKIHGSGHGLTGMRERISLLGGELWAGPRPEGGYQVVARLPAAEGR